MRIKNSFWATLVQSGDITSETIVEKVRQTMLSALDQLNSPSVRGLDDRISNARDINSLWYLRSDLMTAIATERGEEIASQQLNAVTDVFRAY